MKKILLDDTFETITLTIRLKNIHTNLVFGYNPHFQYSNEFNRYLGDFLISLILNFPSFIIGELNQDLLTNKGDILKALMGNDGMKLPYNNATHFQRNCSSLIDIVCSNDEEFI